MDRQHARGGVHRRNNFTVSVDNASDSFAPSGSGYAPTQGNGATLTVDASTGDLTYTSPGGTVAVFVVNTFGAAHLPVYENAYARASSITYPGGVRVDFTYKTQVFCRGGEESGQCPGGYVTALRLQSQTNTNGYQLKFTYAADTIDPPTIQPGPFEQITQVQAINNAVEYCDPAADSCALTGSWPKLTIGATTVTDPMNRTTTYTSAYSGAQLTSFKVRRPGASADTVVVTYAGSRVQTLTAEGVTYGYAYVDAPAPSTQRTTTVTDPLGHTRIYVGDKATSLLASSTDELGRTTLYTYDTAGKGHLTDIQYPEGSKAHYDHDARGNVTATTLISKTPGTPANIVATAAYPTACTAPWVNAKTCNKPTSTTDPRGKVTDYTWDPNTGGVATVTLPKPVAGASVVRPKTTYTYQAYQAYYKNASGAIVASNRPTWRLTGVSAQACTTTATCASDPQPSEASFGYGPQVAGTANNLLPVTRTAGAGTLLATSAASYDAIGNVTTVDGPLPGAADTTRTLWDADREVVGVIGPDPDGAGALPNRAVRVTYNADGQPTVTETGTTAGQTDPAWAAFASLRQEETTFDANARALKRQLRVAGTAYAQTEWAYDALGRLSCTAVRMNPATFGAASPNACALRTTGSSGADRITKVEYTDAGELLRSTSGVGTSAAGVDAEYAYTADGRVLTAKDGNGNLTTYGYDGFDRPVSTAYPSKTTAGQSSTTDVEFLGYDAASRVTSRQVRSGQQFVLGYDDLDRLTSSTGPASYNNYALSWGYDNLGRLTSATGDSQPTYTRAYDALGRVLSETSAWNGTLGWEWDLAGRRTKQTWNDGFFVVYDRLVTGELSAVRENGASSGAGLLATFAYDAQGRRTGITRGNGTSTSYGYAAGSPPVDTPWLTSLAHNVAGSAKDVTTTFAYNPAGQIASSTRTNDLYAYTAATNGTKTTTVNGLNQATAVGSTTLSYDANGNTTAIGASAYTYTPDNQLRPGEAGMVYDGFGNLLSLQSDASVLRSVDGQIVAEHDAATGAIRNRYVWGDGPDEALVWYGGADTANRHWLLTDERGSVVASTGVNGVATINAYDEYGVPAATNVGRIGYTGQYWLPALGLWSYKARVYAPTLGRFMQTDPVGYAAGMNLYAYVGGDPVNATDPSGLTPSAFGSGADCTGTRLCRPDGGTGGSSWGGGNTGGGGDGRGGSQWVPSTDPFASGIHRDCIGDICGAPYLIPYNYFGVGFEGGSAGNGEAWGGGAEADDVVVTAIVYRGHYHDQLVRNLSNMFSASGVPNVRELLICIVGRPVCARADIFGGDMGTLFVTEVKTGPKSSFTLNQLAVYPHLAEGGLVTSYDRRVKQFGLTPGTPFPSISGFLFYKRDPSSTQIVIPF